MLASFAAFVALAVSASAHAIEKRQATTGGGDAAVLNYALTLEHLENTFYRQGLANFSDADFTSAGLPAGTRAYISQIAGDEASHVDFLTGALKAAGATPVQECKYNFGVKDVTGFLGLAQVLEGVGVSAYLGAAGSIENTAYLTAAGSILTIEARHSAFIRLVNGRSPFPSPNDTPATPKAVVSLAGSFFASCPDGSAPSIQPFPAATLTTTSPKLGSALAVTLANSTTAAGNGTQYCAFASGVSTAYAPYTNGQCTLPATGVSSGQIYGYITNAQNLTDATTVAGPFIIELDAANKTSFSAGGSNGTGVSAATTGKTPNSGAGQLAAATGMATVVGAVASLAFLGLA